MKVSVTRSHSFGLEVFRVWVDGALYSEFLSENMARTVYARLLTKLGMK
jgi:hypothetical protein